MKSKYNIWNLFFALLLLTTLSCKKEDEIGPNLGAPSVSSNATGDVLPLEFFDENADRNSTPRVAIYRDEYGRYILAWPQLSTIRYQNAYPFASTVNIKMSARVDDSRYVYEFNNVPAFAFSDLPSSGFYTNGAVIDFKGTRLMVEDQNTYVVTVTANGPNTSLQNGNPYTQYLTASGTINVYGE